MEEVRVDRSYHIGRRRRYNSGRFNIRKGRHFYSVIGAMVFFFVAYTVIKSRSSPSVTPSNMQEDSEGLLSSNLSPDPAIKSAHYSLENKEDYTETQIESDQGNAYQYENGIDTKDNKEDYFDEKSAAGDNIANYDNQYGEIQVDNNKQSFNQYDTNYNMNGGSDPSNSQPLSEGIESSTSDKVVGGDNDYGNLNETTNDQEKNDDSFPWSLSKIFGMFSRNDDDSNTAPTHDTNITDAAQNASLQEQSVADSQIGNVSLLSGMNMKTEDTASDSLQQNPSGSATFNTLADLHQQLQQQQQQYQQSQQQIGSDLNRPQIQQQQQPYQTQTSGLIGQLQQLQQDQLQLAQQTEKALPDQLQQEQQQQQQQQQQQHYPYQTQTKMENAIPGPLQQQQQILDQQHAYPKQQTQGQFQQQEQQQQLQQYPYQTQQQQEHSGSYGQQPLQQQQSVAGYTQGMNSNPLQQQNSGVNVESVANRNIYMNNQLADLGTQKTESDGNIKSTEKESIESLIDKLGKPDLSTRTESQNILNAYNDKLIQKNTDLPMVAQNENAIDKTEKLDQLYPSQQNLQQNLAPQQNFDSLSQVNLLPNQMQPNIGSYKSDSQLNQQATINQGQIQSNSQNQLLQQQQNVSPVSGGINQADNLAEANSAVNPGMDMNVGGSDQWGQPLSNQIGDRPVNNQFSGHLTNQQEVINENMPTNRIASNNGDLVAGQEGFNQWTEQSVNQPSSGVVNDMVQNHMNAGNIQSANTANGNKALDSQVNSDFNQQTNFQSGHTLWTPSNISNSSAETAEQNAANNALFNYNNLTNVGYIGQQDQQLQALMQFDNTIVANQTLNETAHQQNITHTGIDSSNTGISNDISVMNIQQSGMVPDYSNTQGRDNTDIQPMLAGTSGFQNNQNIPNQQSLPNIVNNLPQSNSYEQSAAFGKSDMKVEPVAGNNYQVPSRYPEGESQIQTGQINDQYVKESSLQQRLSQEQQLQQLLQQQQLQQNYRQSQDGQLQQPLPQFEHQHAQQPLEPPHSDQFQEGQAQPSLQQPQFQEQLQQQAQWPPSEREEQPQSQLQQQQSLEQNQLPLEQRQSPDLQQLQALQAPPQLHDQQLQLQQSQDQERTHQQHLQLQLPQSFQENLQPQEQQQPLQIPQLQEAQENQLPQQFQQMGDQQNFQQNEQKIHQLEQFGQQNILHQQSVDLSNVQQIQQSNGEASIPPMINELQPLQEQSSDNQALPQLTSDDTKDKNQMDSLSQLIGSFNSVTDSANQAQTNDQIYPYQQDQQNQIESDLIQRQQQQQQQQQWQGDENYKPDEMVLPDLLTKLGEIVSKQNKYENRLKSIESNTLPTLDNSELLNLKEKANQLIDENESLKVKLSDLESRTNQNPDTKRIENLESLLTEKLKRLEEGYEERIDAKKKEGKANEKDGGNTTKEAKVEVVAENEADVSETNIPVIDKPSENTDSSDKDEKITDENGTVVETKDLKSTNVKTSSPKPTPKPKATPVPKVAVTSKPKDPESDDKDDECKETVVDLIVEECDFFIDEYNDILDSIKKVDCSSKKINELPETIKLTLKNTPMKSEIIKRSKSCLKGTPIKLVKDDSTKSPKSSKNTSKEKSSAEDKAKSPKSSHNVVKRDTTASKKLKNKKPEITRR